ncbi:G-type lectin S-receptor-like serine/threonine-protein kinase At1g61360 [Raphanus sativus]|uniref:Receptor-like serine/threonine-protein kinase n=1 Tax=Raphanus sativus TaxID=3726 RepID=A0A6J0KGW5_RAPSA|nr:G-type lectin S-receptor-like serine/threonine-protein kinase At1g61360 [Raphanus sativus]XP_056847973.1 G-type lectin S-receptor-like serine/threonine-protein kinase At1g61360 [Raphanus sativus]
MSSTFYFPCLLLLTLFWTYGSADITTSTPLSIRQTLSSPDGSFELGFFSPNTSQNHQYLGIWFKRVTPRVYVWVANRENPVTSLTANLTISSNGTLILLDEKQALLWSSGEESLLTSNQCHAELSNSGNLVVVDNVTGTYLWQSFDHLTDTMLPLSSLMYDIPNNTRRVLTSWRSNTDPSPGEFLAELTPEVPPQGLVWKGSSPYWRSGPWAETRFSGIPEMDETYVNPLTMVQDVVNGTGVLTFCALRNFDVSYIKLTPDGSLDIHRSNGGTTGWIKHFEGPRSSCDLYGTCGPNGLCIRSTNSTPTCECLKGFVPKSDDEWNSGNWTRGCVRRTELSSCQGKDTSDGFYRVANMKPPDSYELVSFGDAEECRKGCLSNCSCLAFSYIKGIGCLVWNKELLDMVQFSEEGEFLFIRLARSELAGSKRIKIVVVSAISLCMFIILGLAAFWCWRYRLKQNGEARVAMETSEDSWKSSLKLQDVSGLNFFEMHTIQTATDNFSISNKLGQGGFGTVYKGKLEDGKEIAIKRLSSTSVEGTEEFMNELKLISKLQHRNLVRLLGYCIEGEEKLLVYEFMVNKSLDTFLFDLKKKLEIDWPKRFNIIQGIARGLVYLHRDSFLRVVHRDLKASNILLDEKMNPKISDFGLARMFQGTQNQDSTGRVFGTLGYMSPEYAWTGTFSEKSDIYSFGVLMLEIISGKEISSFSYGKENKNLLAHAWESWSETGGVELLDQDIADSESDSVEAVMRCVQISLLCVQHQAMDRPNIKQVVTMLTSKMDLPKPKQPMFVLDTSDEDSGSKSNDDKDLFSDDENNPVQE